MMDRAKYVYQKWIFSPETNEERAVQTDIFHSIKINGGTETKKKKKKKGKKSAQLTPGSFKLKSCEKQRDAGEFSASPFSYPSCDQRALYLLRL